MDVVNSYSLANDLSRMTMNRVLAGEVSLDEALIGIMISPLSIYAQSLPKEQVEQIINDGAKLAMKMEHSIGDSRISIAELTEACSILIRSIYEMRENRPQNGEEENYER